MKKSCLAVSIALVLCSTAIAEERFSPTQNQYSQTNHGGIGLIQMPTARMNEAGAFSLNYQDSEEYRFCMSGLNVLHVS